MITLADWFHPAALGATGTENIIFRMLCLFHIISILEAWMAGSPEPIPDSGLINGVGRYAGGPAVQRAIINVQQGTRYRFRVVCLSAQGYSFLSSNFTNMN